jgi:large subunit ribosomal protein L28
MAKCDICRKGPQFGNNVSHSNKKTRRQWKPNIHQTTVFEGSVARKIKVCTRCLRTLTKV